MTENPRVGGSISSLHLLRIEDASRLPIYPRQFSSVRIGVMERKSSMWSNRFLSISTTM